MPFLRYSRDKRGYEHVYLVQPTTGRKGKVRARILYWFRTPPNVKVGRDAFDDGARRAIEKQYPEMRFDWPRLLATPRPPMPNPDIERWRERRRQAKAERAAAAAEPQTEREVEAPVEADLSAAEMQEEAAPQTETQEASAAESATPPAAAGQPAEGRRKRRRRRRRGRRGERPAEGAATTPDQPHAPDAVGAADFPSDSPVDEPDSE